MPGRSGASSTTLRITVNGRACHGAHPERGVDAIIASAHVLTGLQSISSRSVSPTTPVIVTVGKIQGGTKGNIVAGTVEMEGTIRALDLETTELVKARVKEVAENAAACCGATADVYMDTKYPPLINDEATALKMLDIAQEVLGEENAFLRTEPSLGAEDFAFFNLACPGAIFRLGVGQDTGHPQMLHNEWFCPDEAGMKTGMLLEVLGTLHFLKEEAK
jgi:amidohydrolase